MSTFGYERRPPSTTCTKCREDLWPEDVVRVALVDTAERFREPRLLRECWSCVPAGPAAP